MSTEVSAILLIRGHKKVLVQSAKVVLLKCFIITTHIMQRNKMINILKDSKEHDFSKTKLWRKTLK